jgi:2-polyprenyl-6-methoxyphenol hydroxylase-like FAD-dependent oxidoreductase
MRTHHSIAVVGAGLGGLTLAVILRRQGIDVAVYEREASAAARHQGGMLDMHEESGQAALRAAGLFEQFCEIVLPGGEATRVLDPQATVRYQDGGEGGNRPEVDRGALRDLLLTGLPGDTVRWGAKIARVRSLGGGRHEATLASGDTFTTDLLIGADGAWSKVRALVSEAAPAYCDVSFVETHLRDADARHPESAAIVGGGSLFALGEEKGILAHRGGDGELHIYAALKVPEDWAAAIDFSDTHAAKAHVLGHFSGWDERLQALVADSDGALVPRTIHALPAAHRWTHRPGVTLLGDAAHLMSPFAGEGANLAMLDGAELAAVMAAHPTDREVALADYEQTMLTRSEVAATQSLASLELCFGPNAAQALSDLMTSFGRQP